MFKMQKLLAFLSGKKTYLSALALLAYGLIEAKTDTIMEAIAILFLRAGVSKSGPISSQATTTKVDDAPKTNDTTRSLLTLALLFSTLAWLLIGCSLKYTNSAFWTLKATTATSRAGWDGWQQYYTNKVVTLSYDQPEYRRLTNQNAQIAGLARRAGASAFLARSLIEICKTNSAAKTQLEGALLGAQRESSNITWTVGFLKGQP